jgi:serine/threonine-protein kinase RIO1
MAAPLADEHQEQQGWDYRLEEIYSGNGDGITVTVFCNTKRFVISFSPLSLLSGKDTIEGPLIAQYEAATEDGIEEEEVEAAQQGLDDLIFATGKESGIFETLAPPIARKKEMLMLNEIIWPEIFYLKFSTVEGTANLIEDVEAQWKEMDMRAKMKIENDTRLLRYSAKDIQVFEEIETPGHITRVLVDGQEMCCKSRDPFNWSTEREIDCLQKIEQSQRSIHVPKLTGLVTSEDDGQIIGILEEYIPTDREKLSTLQDVDASAITGERRKKWGEQIKEMVDVLHEIGVVWGDGKPANVLIHKSTDDAWLIDFGGSWTDGWVDKELRETREGDEQAVKRILDFLQVD